MSISVRLNNVFLLAIAALLACAGCKGRQGGMHPEIAVSNSYLAAVVKDLCGHEQEVFNIVPPGMCPGHFDISPSQVSLLCGCEKLFVFDFQKNIESSISRIKERGLKVHSISPRAGLCLPETYMYVVRQVAEILSSENPAGAEQLSNRVGEIEKRLAQLGPLLQSKVVDCGYVDTGVLISAHQKEFASWLGLNPIALFAGRDEATAADIARNLELAGHSNVRLVIANKQEGTDLAEALAGHLGAEMVVFSNFPSLEECSGDQPSFDALIMNNIRLLENTRE